MSMPRAQKPNHGMLPAMLLALLVAWSGTSSASQPLGSEWWLQMARTNGKEISQDGDVITLAGPGPDGKDLRICQAKPTPVPGRFLVRGQWSYTDVVPIEGWQGARPYLQFYGADGNPLTQGKGRHQLALGKGSHGWSDLDTVITPGAEAVGVRWCIELIGAKTGTVAVKNLGIQPLDRSGAGKGKNVLVLVIDTMRADAMGMNGQKLPITAHIDGLAKQSMFFDRAWTQYTWTVPSTISLFLSQYQRTHGWDSTFSLVVEGKYTEMPSDTQALAQVLRDEGYLTVGHCANPLLKAGVGVGRGFYVWDVADDPEVVKAAVSDIAQWDTDGMPNFLYVHLMAPHVPLHPSEAAKKATKLKVDVPAEGFKYYGQVQSSVPEPQYNEQFKQVYYAAIYDADASIGKVLDALDAAGHADDTLVVLTSDHGELVGEHGLIGHGSNVYEGLTNVPLMLRVPGKKASRVKDRVGQAIDIAPTVLDWLGLASKRPAAWQGVSLFDPAPGQLAVSERDSDIAFTSNGRQKIISARGTGELRNGFDLLADPLEMTPLPADDAAIVGLQADGAKWREDTPVGDPTGRPAVQRTQAEIDQTSAALKALGYVDE